MQRGGQQALVHYLRALQLRRDFTLAHINLGILFETMGRPEKALTEYLKALSSAELHPEVYTWLGQIYTQRGYGSMTEDTIRKTTLVDPSVPLAWHALATGFEASDKRKAAVAWRQFLDVGAPRPQPRLLGPRRRTAPRRPRLRPVAAAGRARAPQPLH